MSLNHFYLSQESSERKGIPITTGVFDYFPAALAYVAKVSKYGNDKHNPGQPMHHARGKSMDHADTIGRHLIDRGGIEPDTGLRHSGMLAWRALALLQEELEREEGAPLARAAKLPEPKMIVPTDHPLAGWVDLVTKPNAGAAGGVVQVFGQTPKYTDGPRAVEGCIL